MKQRARVFRQSFFYGSSGLSVSGIEKMDIYGFFRKVTTPEMKGAIGCPQAYRVSTWNFSGVELLTLSACNTTMGGTRTNGSKV